MTMPSASCSCSTVAANRVRGRGHGRRLTGARTAAAVAVQPVVRCLGLDERGVRKVGDLPPHRGVVDVHEQVVVVDVHGQLEALDQLVVPD